MSLVVCSKNVSTLHHFRDITTFLVYMTACNIEKFFCFHTTNKITGH